MPPRLIQKRFAGPIYYNISNLQRLKYCVFTAGTRTLKFAFKSWPPREVLNHERCISRALASLPHGCIQVTPGAANTTSGSTEFRLPLAAAKDGGATRDEKKLTVCGGGPPRRGTSSFIHEKRGAWRFDWRNEKPEIPTLVTRTIVIITILLLLRHTARYATLLLLLLPQNYVVVAAAAGRAAVDSSLRKGAFPRGRRQQTAAARFRPTRSTWSRAVRVRYAPGGHSRSDTAVTVCILFESSQS